MVKRDSRRKGNNYLFNTQESKAGRKADERGKWWRL